VSGRNRSSLEVGDDVMYMPAVTMLEQIDALHRPSASRPAFTGIDDAARIDEPDHIVGELVEADTGRSDVECGLY
jgi:hypothetical protein